MVIGKFKMNRKGKMVYFITCLSNGSIYFVQTQTKTLELQGEYEYDDIQLFLKKILLSCSSWYL